MSIINTKDESQIYYKDWGTGQPFVFSHGWPLSTCMQRIPSRPTANVDAGGRQRGFQPLYPQIRVDLLG